MKRSLDLVVAVFLFALCGGYALWGLQRISVVEKDVGAFALSIPLDEQHYALESRERCIADLHYRIEQGDLTTLKVDAKLRYRMMKVAGEGTITVVMYFNPLNQLIHGNARLLTSHGNSSVWLQGVNPLNLKVSSEIPSMPKELEYQVPGPLLLLKESDSFKLRYPVALPTGMLKSEKIASSLQRILEMSIVEGRGCDGSSNASLDLMEMVEVLTSNYQELRDTLDIMKK